MTLNAMHQFPFRIRKPLATLCSHPCSLTQTYISYAVHTIAKYAECPRQMHWTTIKRIFRYLKGTTDYGVLYKQCACALVLTCYCDSDYGGDIDTRKS